MKRTLSLALLVLTATTIFAAESKNTPPTSEQITYNGKEYVKRYKYEHFFGGYGSTIYLEGEAQRADSLREVVVEGNRVRRENNLTSSFIHIQDLDGFAKMLHKSFSKKELKKLRQGDDEHAAVFVINIIANRQKEIEHCALAYVGTSPEIDSRIIKLQEEIRDAVTLHFHEGVLSMKVSTKDSDARKNQDSLIQKSRSGDLKMSDLKALIPIENITKITDDNREELDYYFLGQRISYDNIINGYGDGGWQVSK